MFILSQTYQRWHVYRRFEKGPPLPEGGPGVE